MTRAVLLDLNGVVEDLREFVWFRDDLIVSSIGQSLPEDLVRREATAVRRFYQRIMAHNVPEFHLMFWDDLLRRLKLAVDARGLFGVYETFVDHYVHRSSVYSDAAAVIKRNGDSIDFGILSNANSLRARRLLAHHGLLDRFKAVVISHDTPYCKPSGEVFLLAAQRLGKQPSEIVMIGDRLDNDIAGAQQAGMAGVLLDRSGTIFEETIQCRIIDSLLRLDDVLQDPWFADVSADGTADAPTVVIVCGGRGTRLRQKLGDKQKCLALVRGKPILLHAVDTFVAAGLRNFDLLAGHATGEIEGALSHYQTNPFCRMRVLPICEQGTGRALQAYWTSTAAKRGDIIYSHGNIVLDNTTVRQFITYAQAHRANDVVFLASPLWKAPTHAALHPDMGRITQISIGQRGPSQSGLCSVGMAFVRRSVPMEDVNISESGMFEELVEALRSDHRLSVGYYYTDAPWEHLGVPEDWDRLVEE